MKSTKFLATILIAGMLLTGCGAKNSQAVIRINDKIITQSEFDKILDKQISASPFAKMGMDLKNDKNGIMYLMTVRSAVTQLVIEELLDQEVKARGITVSNKEIDEATKYIIDKLGGKSNLSNLLKSNNISVKQFRSDLKKQIMMKKLATTTQNVDVSEKEAKEFYNKNLSKFRHNEQVRAYHILLSTDPMLIGQGIRKNSKKELPNDEVAAKIEKKIKENALFANKIADELKADNTKFVAYAKKYSDDMTTAKRGGDLGYFESNVMVPEFSKAAFSAKPNTVVGPVKTQYGYHIIMVVDRKAAGVEPFEKVRNNLQESLTNEKEIKALDDLVNVAKKKANIEYIDKSYDPDEITKKLTEQLGNMHEQTNKNSNTPNKGSKAPNKGSKAPVKK